MLDTTNFRALVFFTGAGMSKESGVPTFRGPGGIWKSYDYANVACQDAFERDPERVWEFHNYRRSIVGPAEPNPGHVLIAELARTRNVRVITQNIDGLHQRAGSADVIELHGSLWQLRCDACGARHAGRENPLEQLRCACGAYWRPDVVWFDDELRDDTLEGATAALEQADLVVSVGTSGTVYPAAALPRLAKKRGATLVEINPRTTEVSEIHDVHLRTSASQGLRELFGGAD